MILDGYSGDVQLLCRNHLHVEKTLCNRTGTTGIYIQLFLVRTKSSESFLELPSGHFNIAIENGPVEIVSFPIKQNCDFPYLCQHFLMVTPPLNHYQTTIKPLLKSIKPP